MTRGSRGIQWKTHNRTNLLRAAALCLWPGFTNRKSDIFYPALLPKCCPLLPARQGAYCISAPKTYMSRLDWFWINIDSYQAKYTQVGFSYCKSDGFYTTRTTADMEGWSYMPCYTRQKSEGNPQISAAYFTFSLTWILPSCRPI